MKRTLFIFALTLSLSVHSAPANDQLIVATWNVGLIDRTVGDLNLAAFGSEVDPDILVLNEVKTIEDLQEIRQLVGREDDAVAISSFENGDANLEVGIISRHPLADIVEFYPSPKRPGDPQPSDTLLRAPAAIRGSYHLSF